MLQDELSLLAVNTTATHGGQTDGGDMSPQSSGSSLGSPQIAAGWGQLDAGAASSSNVEQSLEGHSAGASGMEDAASSADVRSVADETTTADGGDGGVKEDRWEEVKRPAWKGKGKVLPIKSKGSRSNAARSSTREKSRLGNPNNVVEVPRPSGNGGPHGNGGKSRLGNPSNVREVSRPGTTGNKGNTKLGNASNVREVHRPRAQA